MKITPTFAISTCRGSGLLAAKSMRQYAISFHHGQMATPTFSISTHRGSGLLAANCMIAVCYLFSIVVRGPLLHFQLAHTVGAAFRLRIA